MKKILCFASLAMLIGITGCTKKEIVTPNITVTTTIRSSDWQYDNSTKTWYVNIDMPEIDSYVNDTNGILVSISFGDGVYELIPDIYNGYAFYVTHSPGNLTIEAQNQLGTTYAPSTAIIAKIVIVASQ
ncbi:MAG TPA: hypothetical protein VG738_07745 [Chitinophagaceae bacterium]|nr:hypothetical protein [Chitinophagaceae bacterium]